MTDSILNINTSTLFSNSSDMLRVEIAVFVSAAALSYVIFLSDLTLFKKQ